MIDLTEEQIKFIQTIFSGTENKRIMVDILTAYRNKLDSVSTLGSFPWEKDMEHEAATSGRKCAIRAIEDLEILITSAPDPKAEGKKLKQGAI